jgi:hypothetical protein
LPLIANSEKSSILYRFSGNYKNVFYYEGEKYTGEVAEKKQSIIIDNLNGYARLSYRYPMLDKNIRKTLLSKLYDIGKLEDINNVKLLILNPNEDTEIKEYAELVVGKLKEKFGVR